MQAYTLLSYRRVTETAVVLHDLVILISVFTTPQLQALDPFSQDPNLRLKEL